MIDLGSGGYRVFPNDPALEHWARAALPVARRAISTATDWRCGGTWWPGVDALDNANDGAVGATPLVGAAVDATGWRGRWHSAQLSACRRGYPRKDTDETDAQHRFRLNRDAAHLDGLLPVGPERRRKLREPHAFVLGIGLTDRDPGAAPLVVWDGSHRILGPALSDRLRGDRTPEDVDVTDPYQAARRRVFDTCARREIALASGQAILLHRHLLHGIAPWRGSQEGPRITAYFRPLLSGPIPWLWREPA